MASKLLESKKGMAINEILKIILFIIILVALSFFVTTRLADASDLFLKFLQAIGLAPPESRASAEVKAAMRCAWDRWMRKERPAGEAYALEPETACGYVMNHPNSYKNLEGEVIKTFYCCKTKTIAQLCSGTVPISECYGKDEDECGTNPCCRWRSFLPARGPLIPDVDEEGACLVKSCSSIPEDECADCGCTEPPVAGGECPEGSVPIDTSDPIDGIMDSCIAWEEECAVDNRLNPTICDSQSSDPNIDTCEDMCKDERCEYNEGETVERKCSSGRSNNADIVCECLLKCPCWDLDKGGTDAVANDGRVTEYESKLNPIQVYIDGEFTLYEDDANYLIGYLERNERIHVSPTCDGLGWFAPGSDVNVIQLHQQLLPSNNQNIDCSTSPDKAAYTKCQVSGNTWGFVWLDGYGPYVGDEGRGYNLLLCNYMYDLAEGCGGSEPEVNDMKCKSQCCRDDKCKIADWTGGCRVNEDCCNSDLPSICCDTTCCPVGIEAGCCGGNTCYDREIQCCCENSLVVYKYSGQTCEQACGSEDEYY